jgi:cytochrome b561
MHVKLSMNIVTATVMRWGLRRPKTISDLFRVAIGFLIILDMSIRVLWQLLVETSSSKAGETWRRNGS